jgi:hypothetical protein
MSNFLDIDVVAGGSGGVGSGGAVTPVDLADTLARLVWEGFSDFLVEPSTRVLLAQLGAPVGDEDLPDERTAEELLILHLWAHTRAVQLSYFRRAPEALVRETLDALHQAVFEDMVANGTPRHQLPLFEQRVGARYAEYYEAAERSDEGVGAVAAGHLAAEEVRVHPDGARLLAERAVEVANPLRDYLDELELIDP